MAENNVKQTNLTPEEAIALIRPQMDRYRDTLEKLGAAPEQEETPDTKK